MPYIGVSPQFGVRKKHTYTATAGQTSFSGAGSEGATLSYKDSNFVAVYQNGVKLGDADYTSTSGTAIVLAQGASVSDLVEIIVFDAFSAADTVSKADGGTFDGDVTFAGAFTSQGIDDNADATAITIDSSENVGIGQAPETGYHANWTAVDIGNRGGLAQYKTTGDVTLTYNLYHDGAWKAKETAPSARYVIGAGPYHIWYTGASASADGAVTLTERMRISDVGNVGIGV